MPMQRSGRPLDLELQVQGSNLSPPSSLRSCVTLSKAHSLGLNLISGRMKILMDLQGFCKDGLIKPVKAFTTGP